MAYCGMSQCGYSVQNVIPAEIPDSNLNSMTSLEGNRQAAALNHLLGEIGLTKNEQTAWWNLVAQPDLGNRTATRAWLDGDINQVRELVEHWYENSKSAADRASKSPEFLAMLRQKLSEIDNGPLGNSPIRQSA
jgi:hypothetical protein